MSAQPRTARGTRTRARLLAAAEEVFASAGYHDASIVKITEQAGIGLGTFYLYFAGKQEIFDEVVDDLNARVRHAMTEAARTAGTRLEAERAGFRAFFRFTAEHPALYRIIRQAEFVSPAAQRRHYENIVRSYVHGLAAAQEAGEVRPVDPEVAAWALMGMGELFGMRYILWEAEDRGAGGPRVEIPDRVLDELMGIIQRGLAPAPAPADRPREDASHE
ncbi:TetR family transcriptional regulator [Sinomonas atrocyanea]|uniref:TetR family transcriptional regulator n=1 Tax=Sinomonas atrocyanea TaxID=37927 RepID=A0A127A3P0_9MICC|nr:TetR/AcrR family transcriptional regulator [Sinomonas atrocyanea]AMM33255.1 TetR family transcriptional regulator [Sinomonas atrocyanea]GEB63649.1 TetR family transcriptional regulator [Sinomonas atrocyanea]GGG58128.1 TetR family transcriptional regulator [Sinomonas atrocyanea]